MDLDVRPPVTDEERLAIRRALADAGVPLSPDRSHRRGEWSRAGALEAVDDEPAGERYAPLAPSPRSTRGATRA